jgi:ribonuclease D
VYESLLKTITKSNRMSWVEEELAVLTDPATYVVEPPEAWKRVRTRSSSGRFMAIVRELAHFREEFAQVRNIPRSRVYKDDALLEIASNKPANLEELGNARLLLREARKGEIADGILEAVKRGLACPPSDFPPTEGSVENAPVNPALADLLRVLLKAKADKEGVAIRLLASAADLDHLAGGGRDVPALHGWRLEVFGNDALRLCEGKIALAVKGHSVRAIEI